MHLEYQTYLNLAGSDNDEHYQIKIDASKILLDHVNDTFVTPVFNGSASLRDAAGQLIENVAKSVRRRETVDEAYIDELFDDVSSLYHLDQVGSNEGSKEDLGPLPMESIALIVTLVVVWVFVIIYLLKERYKKIKVSQ